MIPIELSEEIAFELESMKITVDELVSLHQDMVHKEPTLRDKTAAAAFLSQFYSGLKTFYSASTVFRAFPRPLGKPGI